MGQVVDIIVKSSKTPISAGESICLSRSPLKRGSLMRMLPIALRVHVHLMVQPKLGTR
jgi:hypothetical protein